MSDENELDSSAGFILVSLLAPFFRHAGRGVAIVAVVLPLVASRAVVASPCLACFLPLVLTSPFLRRVCLLSVPPNRRIARLPARSTSGAGR